MIYFCVKLQKDPLYGLNLTFFAPWLPWQQPPFWICSTPPKAATHYGGYSYKDLWSLMKGIKKKLNHPFLFPWQLRKSLSNRFRFFGLSRSTRWGCCSLQVSSISVRRVTCYDHFCVFQFFSILAVSMATAAILKIQKVVCTSTHSA
jgi:hypothetical protein